MLLHSFSLVPILKRIKCSIILFSILKYYFPRIYKVFKFCYVTLRFPLNMKLFRHPVFKIKQDVSETGSLPFHRRKDMVERTPSALTQKNTVSVGVSD